MICLQEEEIKVKNIRLFRVSWPWLTLALVILLALATLPMASTAKAG
jgi:hypothetical protein